MLNRDYHDMLSAFRDEGGEYLVVVAYALAAHGLPRATGDIDLWIRATPENAARVWRALGRFGAPLAGISAADFTVAETAFQIGVAPKRVDILTSIEAVSFDDAWPARKEVEIEDLRVPILSRSHLVANKKALGRPKDLGDIEWLEERDTGEP